MNDPLEQAEHGALLSSWSMPRAEAEHLRDVLRRHGIKAIVTPQDPRLPNEHAPDQLVGPLWVIWVVMAITERLVPPQHTARDAADVLALLFEQVPAQAFETVERLTDAALHPTPKRNRCREAITKLAEQGLRDAYRAAWKAGRQERLLMNLRAWFEVT